MLSPSPIALQNEDLLLTLYAHDPSRSDQELPQLSCQVILKLGKPTFVHDVPRQVSSLQLEIRLNATEKWS